MVHFLYKTNVVLLVGFCEISMSCFVNYHNSTTLVLSIKCEYIKILWTYKILSCPAF